MEWLVDVVASVTADPSRLQSMGALAAERNGLVVALAMGAVSFQSERKMQHAEPISRLTGKASLQSSAGFATRST
jgi:hypothetical protein